MIVLWNTIYLEAVLEQFRKEGYPVNEEDKARLSCLIHAISLWLTPVFRPFATQTPNTFLWATLSLADPFKVEVILSKRAEQNNLRLGD